MIGLCEIGVRPGKVIKIAMTKSTKFWIETTELCTSRSRPLPAPDG